jgi:hypothetical protein
VTTYVCNIENEQTEETPLVAPSTAEALESPRVRAASGSEEEPITNEAPLLAPTMSFAKE